MADVKISGLTAKGATLEATDELEINEAGTSKKVTGQQIVDLVPTTPAASATQAGIVELATDGELVTGTSTVLAVTPANITALTSSITQAGIVELATDAESITGTDTARAVTPANLKAVMQAPGKFTGTTKGGDIASASPLVIGTDGDMFDVTGTTAFSAMTVAANRMFILQWDGIVTVTHGASLGLPGGADLTTAAGDVWTCYSTAANTVIVTNVATAAAAGGGGAWNLINTAVASNSASLTVTGLDSTYDTFAIAISDIDAAGAATAAHLQFGDSSGVDVGGGDYCYHSPNTNVGGSSYAGASSNADEFIKLHGEIGNSTGDMFGAMLFLHRPGDGVGVPTISGTTVATKNVLATQESKGGFMFGARLAVITLDRVRFKLASGNITSGRMTVWGISHA